MKGRCAHTLGKAIDIKESLLAFRDLGGEEEFD
jgi:hypothetical protein